MIGANDARITVSPACVASSDADDASEVVAQPEQGVQDKEARKAEKKGGEQQERNLDR